MAPAARGSVRYGQVKVLVADDHPIVRDALRLRLVSHGDTAVATVGTGEEAIRTATATPPDVLLCDYAMPDVDGIAVVKRLRAAGSALPVLILSGHDDGQVVRAAIRAGATGFLSKSCSADELHAAVHDAAAGGRYVFDSSTATKMAEIAAEPDEGGFKLAPRELEVIELLASGVTSNADLAAAMFISESTVSTHLTRACKKLDVHDKTALLAAAYRHGYIQPPAGPARPRDLDR